MWGKMWNNVWGERGKVCWGVRDVEKRAEVQGEVKGEYGGCEGSVEKCVGV